MERGYTYVMVDLRGFGGSSGCLDWGGPGEQSDVKAAVEWAASQPWSTGHVGMYGKSYDGVTGLMGVALKPAGLDAVVSQEPVYDMYRYLYSNRVRFSNSFLTPALYTAIDATPGSIQDDPGYNVNGADNTARPGCYAANYLDQQSDDHGSAYWKSRDLIAKGAGSTVAALHDPGLHREQHQARRRVRLLQRGRRPQARVVRDVGPRARQRRRRGGRLAMGRHGWFDEVMRFYDQYLRGTTPSVQDPPVAVETSDGTWRSETRWPPADASSLTTVLRSGSYTDDAQNNGTAEGGSPNGQGIWTFSPPLAHDAHLAGVRKRDGQRDDHAARREPRRRRLRRRLGPAARRSSAAAPTCCPAAARSPSTSTGTTGSCRPAIASACCSPRRTPSGGCTARRCSRSR